MFSGCGDKSANPKARTFPADLQAALDTRDKIGKGGEYFVRLNDFRTGKEVDVKAKIMYDKDGWGRSAPRLKYWAGRTEVRIWQAGQTEIYANGERVQGTLEGEARDMGYRVLTEVVNRQKAMLAEGETNLRQAYADIIPATQKAEAER